MKVFKIIASLSFLYLLITGCRREKKDNIMAPAIVKNVRDSSLKFIIEKFSLSYPDDLIIDSNSLIFYCSRSFDTSSLIHLQKTSGGARGVFYEILPTYHQYVNDYADQKSKLLFFEGYSFVVDSAIWKSIRDQAQSILQTKDSFNNNERFTDGKTFALYYNYLSSQGNSNNEAKYEKFDKFLKDRLLEQFIQTRKPKMHKIR